MSLYRVSGVVEAPDGTTYRPLFYGDFYQACRVRDAIKAGAADRGEGYLLAIEAGGDDLDGWRQVGVETLGIAKQEVTL